MPSGKNRLATGTEIERRIESSVSDIETRGSRERQPQGSLSVAICRILPLNSDARLLTGSRPIVLGRAMPEEPRAELTAALNQRVEERA